MPIKNILESDTRNKQSPDCGVLILSCDKNINLLKIFFDFFKKNWNDCQFPIYLGLEQKTIDFFECTVLNSSEKTWAARVRDYLYSIDESYVLVILDDFIIEKTVDIEILHNALNHMLENPDTANITLTSIVDKKRDNKPSQLNNFLLRPKNADYLLNMQIGIWNKEVFNSLLKDKESPWQTELFGSIRARKLKHKFYCLEDDLYMPIKYNHGWLIVRGAWNGNEIIRLNLFSYADSIFDGKNILYSDFGGFSLTYRIIRRCNIMIRQCFSWFQIYI